MGGFPVYLASMGGPINPRRSDDGLSVVRVYGDSRRRRRNRRTYRLVAFSLQLINNVVAHTTAARLIIVIISGSINRVPVSGT